MEFVYLCLFYLCLLFFQAEDGIREGLGVFYTFMGY